MPDISNYTLDQFIIFLDAAERAEAVSRITFATDVAVSVGSIFSADAFTKHLDSLQGIANGE